MSRAIPSVSAPRLRLAVSIIGAALARPGAAQSQDVVTLLQELSRKVDRLQGDVDALKGARKTAPPARTAQPAPTGGEPGTGNTSSASALKPGEKFAEGWVVSVHSVTDREQAGESIGRFVAPNEGFTFGQARQGVYYHAHAIFRGVALYRVKEPGRYVMLNRISWSEQSLTNFYPNTRCYTSGKFLEQTIIAKESTVFEAWSKRDTTKQFSGGFDAKDAGAYVVSFEVACSLGHAMESTASVMGNYPASRNWFDTIRFEVLFNGPNDLKARVPNEAELFHKMLASERRQ